MRVGLWAGVERPVVDSLETFAWKPLLDTSSGPIQADSAALLTDGTILVAWTQYNTSLSRRELWQGYVGSYTELVSGSAVVTNQTLLVHGNRCGSDCFGGVSNDPTSASKVYLTVRMWDTAVASNRNAILPAPSTFARGYFLYSSTNGGASWTYVARFPSSSENNPTSGEFAQSFPPGPISATTVSGTNYLIHCGNNMQDYFGAILHSWGHWRSTNGGTTWTRTNNAAQASSHRRGSMHIAKMTDQTKWYWAVQTNNQGNSVIAYHSPTPIGSSTTTHAISNGRLGFQIVIATDGTVYGVDMDGDVWTATQSATLKYTDFTETYPNLGFNTTGTWGYRQSNLRQLGANLTAFMGGQVMHMGEITLST